MGRLLVAAGCVSDGTIPPAKDDHNDLWEEAKPEANLIVMRRHVAIGRRPFWARDPNLVIALWMEGYDVFGIVMSRCQIITEMSKVAAPHAADLEVARCQQLFETQLLYQSIPGDCPFDVVQYESLVQHPRLYLDALGARWGLQFPDSIERITDGNHKYWEALRG
jgi:hypothetical protein